jgi:predicted lipoprotein with Yx(FWY)xxD motif
MKRAWFVVFLPGALGALSACGASPSINAHAVSTATATPTKAPTATATAAAPTIGVRTTSLGQILVDGCGRALYLFVADTSRASMCYGACAHAWPPDVTAAGAVPGPGVSQPLLGTTSRTDGTKQVTYNGHPLYYFAGDTQSGDTKGQSLPAFGADWYVVSPAGSKIDQS